MTTHRETTTLTFVTSFFHIYATDYDNKKSMPWRIQKFRELAETGIKICVYVSIEVLRDVLPFQQEFPDNVLVVKIVDKHDTFVGKYLRGASHGLPQYRNETKDIEDYMTIINSKTEFMADAIEKNPWNSTHFAWIDFNISHIFFQIEKTQEYLHHLGKVEYLRPTCFVAPGYWELHENMAQVLDQIYWRYLGGFFLGDKQTILQFHRLYREYFPKFIEQYQTLVWEVNFWSWLESHADFQFAPIWFKAGHTDDMVTMIPPEIFEWGTTPIGQITIPLKKPTISTVVTASSVAPCSLTFVTSFLNIYNIHYNNKKTTTWRIAKFREVARLGIKICIYICEDVEPMIRPIEAEFPDNVKIMKIVKYEETLINKMLQEHCSDYQLPQIRNGIKDSDKYMIVINSKTEFMTDTIERNPWNSTHFAWIDFNISYVFPKKYYTMPFLKWLGTLDYFKPTCFVIPGTYAQYGDHMNVHSITDDTWWRFCGGFFLGDKQSILRFHALYQEYFPQFIKAYKRLTWEINFWSWLEYKSDWNPRWYLADHNDTIICDLWCETVTRPLVTIPGVETVVYDYPTLDPLYYPSSASFLEFGGRFYLNTRFVNYKCLDNGCYFFYEQSYVIRNRNFCAELDENMIPKWHREVRETIDLPKYDQKSVGVEDIRLYECHGKIKYIATTMGYHDDGGTRMIIGNYCVGEDDVHYEDSRLVQSPEKNHLEKNWIPLVLDNPESPYHQRELFIYKWSPFLIGELNEGKISATTEIDMIERVDTSKNPYFFKIKGSTPFLDTGDYLVGVVHYTEETSPRGYVHLLVALDRVTLRPVRYSNPFCFEKVSIEFCVGFTIRDGKYLFWISRMDRDPMLVKVGVEHIALCREFLV